MGYRNFANGAFYFPDKQFAVSEFLLVEIEGIFADGPAPDQCLCQWVATTASLRHAAKYFRSNIRTKNKKLNTDGAFQAGFNKIDDTTLIQV